MQNKIPNPEIFILGIDPGYDRIGVAILSNTKPKNTVVFSTCIETNKKDLHEQRLKTVGEEIEKIISKQHIDGAILEDLFFSKNQTTGIKVAEARGVIQYILALKNIPCAALGPMQVKLAVTGYGKSDKTHIKKMVEAQIVFTDSKKTRLDDEYDAIGIAMAGLVVFEKEKKYPQVLQK